MPAANVPELFPDGRCENKAGVIECKARVHAEPHGAPMQLTMKLEEGVLTHASIWNDEWIGLDGLRDPLTQHLGPPVVGKRNRYGERVHLWSAKDGGEVTLEGNLAVLASAGSAEKLRKEELAETARWLDEFVDFTADGVAVLNGVRLGARAPFKGCEPIMDGGNVSITGKRRWVQRPNMCKIKNPHGPDPTMEELASGTELSFDDARRVHRVVHRQVVPRPAADEFVAEAIRSLPNGSAFQLLQLQSSLAESADSLSMDAHALMDSSGERLRISSSWPGMIDIELTTAPAVDPIYAAAIKASAGE